MANKILEVKDLRVSYGSFLALDGLSLDVEEGEIVALLGSNGAGKTTTINSINGVIPHMGGRINGGQVLFNGQDMAAVPLVKRSALGMTQVPEGRHLFETLTVHENLLVGSTEKTVARKKRKENLELCYQLFPKLHQRRNQLTGSLSGGERQMVAIARALMQCPKLLMFDEPSLGLAPVIVEDVFRIIVDINKNMGTTVLLVEQNVQASLEIADRAFVIENGRNFKSGAASELLGDDELRRAYLGI